MRYRGEQIKIGTCELLYYTTFQKYIAALQSGQLKKSDYGADPVVYAQPDSGCLFRFPFPDEDKVQFGKYAGSEIDFDRGVSVMAPTSILPKADANGRPPNELAQVEIAHQKFVHRISDGKLCLALVCKGPGLFQRFRIEDDEALNCLLRSIIRNHIMGEPDPAKKNFYRQIGSRILKGYRLGIPSLYQAMTNTDRKNKKKRVSASKKKGFGRGI